MDLAVVQFPAGPVLGLEAVPVHMHTDIAVRLVVDLEVVEAVRILAVAVAQTAGSQALAVDGYTYEAVVQAVSEIDVGMGIAWDRSRVAADIPLDVHEGHKGCH